MLIMSGSQPDKTIDETDEKDKKIVQKVKYVRSPKELIKTLWSMS